MGTGYLRQFRVQAAQWLIGAMIALCGVIGASHPAQGCPFCQAFRSPFSNDLRNARYVVVADALPLPPVAAGAVRPSSSTERWPEAVDNGGGTHRESRKGDTDKVNADDDEDEEEGEETARPARQFMVIKVLKGGSAVRVGAKIEAASASLDLPPSEHSTCLLFGFDSPELTWTTPVIIHKSSESYLRQVAQLKSAGRSRLRFFLDWLDHSDPAVAGDAYNEFALAPYNDLVALKDDLDRNWLKQRIGDPRTDEMRMRLYLTMLGIAGTPEDAPNVLELIAVLESRADLALDAAVACYLSLQGDRGLPVVEQRYFANPDMATRNVYSAICALTFHGDEPRRIARERVATSLATALQHAKLADLVIAKLAAWQHWESTPRVAQVFKQADTQHAYLRQAAVRYLRMSVHPEADELLEELKRIDPQSVAQSESFQPIPPPDGTEND